ncbi:uncharacterized protein BXZ73DRAFT_80301 [Epithele typhae]|uniref:uncharacterized protein n=1 Tax=Epithele typhae TaxID=378194 RepID=UPI002008A480|nr:uncharacterized protein BXZ73DRAFT_80301 [Epithele typhae]KAH9919786.1 hypothetical protein BXZ73DRAFT_80301 [Epithele typhae]
MSTEGLGDQISQVIEEYQELYTDEYVLVAASDVSLMHNVLNFIELKFVHNRCTTLGNTLRVLEYIQPLPPAAFSAMRALALSQSRPLAILVLVFSIVNVGINFGIFQYRTQSFSDPTWGCLVNVLPIPRPLLITSRVFRCFSHSEHSSHGNHLERVSLIANFGDPLTTVLVSRFLLDLQEAHQRTIKLGSDDPLHSSAASESQVGIGSLRFAVDAMGSIGADLRILDEVNASEEEEIPVTEDVDSTA